MAINKKQSDWVAKIVWLSSQKVNQQSPNLN